MDSNSMIDPENETLLKLIKSAIFAVKFRINSVTKNSIHRTISNFEVHFR